jgi:hypothetical protein
MVDVVEDKTEILLGMNDIISQDDPNMWIADSAATVHTTPFKRGMVDIKKANNNSYITMGNGKVEEFK